MIVAVNADALTGIVRRGRGDGAGAGVELDASAEDDGGVVGDGFCELGHTALESAEGEGELRVDAIGVGDEIGGREALGEEGGIVGWGGESEMHLVGAAAEECGSFEAECSVFASVWRNFMF